MIPSRSSGVTGGRGDALVFRADLYREGILDEVRFASLELEGRSWTGCAATAQARCHGDAVCRVAPFALAENVRR